MHAGKSSLIFNIGSNPELPLFYIHMTEERFKGQILKD